MIAHEQKWEDRKMVKTTRDAMAIGAEHWRSEECKVKGTCGWGKAEAGPGVDQARSWR